MKKSFLVIFAALLCAASLVGCGASTSNNNSTNYGEWLEIQSVTYCTNINIGNTTITSLFRVKSTEPELITQEEYDNSSEDEKTNSILLSRYGIISVGNFSINRESNLQTLQNSVNKTYYYEYENIYHCKATVESYEIHYVKIRFLGNDTLELNYCENATTNGYTTIRVKPISYVVTFFNN